MAEKSQPAADQPAEEVVLGMKRELKQTLFDRVLKNLLTVLFSIMIAIVMLQVVVRYGVRWTGISLHWTEEVARYLLVITAFLGSAVAWRKRDNITISALTDLLPGGWRYAADLFKDTTILIFALLCVYGSYGMSQRTRVARLGSIGFVRLGHLYLALGVCFAFISVYMVRWIVRDVRDIVAHKRSGSAAEDSQ